MERTLPYQRPSVLNSPPKSINGPLQQSSQYQPSASLAPLLSASNASTSSYNHNNNDASIPRPLIASTSSSEWETKSQPNPSSSNGTSKVTPLGIKKPKAISTTTAKSENGAQQGVKTRVKRSKLACFACKAVKQRCSSDDFVEGQPNRGCRRCELYALECHFPVGPREPSTPGASSNNKPTPTKSNGNVVSKVDSNNLSRPDRSGPSNYHPNANYPNSNSNSPVESLLLQKLTEISGRLNSIEMNLHQQENQQREIIYQQQHHTREMQSQHRHMLLPPILHPPLSPSRSIHRRIPPLSDLARSSSHSHSHSHSRRELSDASEDGEYETESIARMDLEADEAETERAGKGTNPLKAVQESFQLVEENEEGCRRIVSGPGSTGDSEYGAPDAIKRGLLTEIESQNLFNLFFEHIHPWVMMLDIKEDSQSMLVHARSPLLFHTILLLASSYDNPFPSTLHTTLITFTNSILAPQILSPQPNELNCDFLRAIDLLNLFKPTQIAARRQDGMSEAQSMRVSKLNTLASWMLQTLLSRVCEKIGLPQVSMKFSRAYSECNGVIPVELTREIRLYFLLLCNDVHGNLQSGRRCNLEGAAALMNTRIFASMNIQPYDCRLAASVEMYELARPILKSTDYEITRRISREELERFNSGMLVFEAYWRPILIEKLGTDELAMTVLCPNMDFILLTFNASAYVSWKVDRNFEPISPLTNSPSSNESRDPVASLKRSRRHAEGPRGLNDWEYDALKRCVIAAENLIFRLSVESRDRVAWRKVKWEEAEREEHYRQLVLDDTLVESCSWAMDANHIARFFALVFLLKLVDEGLLNADLVLSESPQIPVPWIHAQKLPRLLELGASFLDRLSLNPHHPSKGQAKVLRTLLASKIDPTVVLQPSSLSTQPRQQQHTSNMAAVASSPPRLDPTTPREIQSFPSPLMVPFIPSQSHQQSHQRWSSTTEGIALTGDILSPNLSMQDPQDHLSGLSPAIMMDDTFSAALDGFDLSDTSAFWRDNGIDWSFDYPQSAPLS